MTAHQALVDLGMLEDERDDSQNDEYDDEPLGDIPTETGDSSRSEKSRDNCEYQKENREFEKATPKLQWV